MTKEMEFAPLDHVVYPTHGVGQVIKIEEQEISGMSLTLDTLKGRARIKRTMWSRRAQEYEAKINSGDPIQIAEVVRDLHRSEDQPDQSYSERQIYEAALARLSRELAVVEQIEAEAATEKVQKFLKVA